MRIEKVKIDNYRSFGNQVVEIIFPDIEQPVSIIGYNNSGKSNIIRGILCACGQKPYGYNYCIDDFHNQSEEDIEILVEFDRAFGISTIYGKDKDKYCKGVLLSIKRKDLDVSGFSYCLDQELEIIREQEHLRGRSLPTLINKYKDQIKLIYIDPKNLNKHLIINSYSLLGKVLEDIKKDFKSPNNTVKKKDGIEVPRSELFSSLMKYIESSLIKTEKFEELLNSIGKSLIEQLNLHDNSLSLSFKLPESDEIYDSMEFRLTDGKDKPALPLDNLGDGFRAMLIIAILQTLLNTDEGGYIILLEEPETYLHENYQEYFYKLLKKLAKKNQVIYTTHSKKFVDVFNPESVIKVSCTDFIESTVSQSTGVNLDFPNEIDGYTLSNPEDYPKFLRTLEPNIGNILFSEKVIIVEGPHDLFVYKTILLEKVDFEIRNITIVAAWGKDSIVTIIQICKLFHIPYFIIHDKDLIEEIDKFNEPNINNKEYMKLDKNSKSQYTKNFKIHKEAGDKTLVHRNAPNLEQVLNIQVKGMPEILQKLNEKNYQTIKKSFPNLISNNLERFLDLKHE
jgi:predicted ATP-dependent endonuclease of OLD family